MFTLLPRGAAPPCPSGRQGPRPPLLTNGKYPNTQLPTTSRTSHWFLSRLRLADTHTLIRLPSSRSTSSTACTMGLQPNTPGRPRREPSMLVACTSFVPPSRRHCAHYCQHAPSRGEHALGDWSHLLAGVTRPLYRRLGLDEVGFIIFGHIKPIWSHKTYLTVSRIKIKQGLHLTVV